MTVPSQDISSIQRAYRPLLELGRGGMARVYLAESLASGLRKLVVLKVLNAEAAANSELRAAFRREAELSAQMNHPNVAQVFEVAEYSNIPVIAMEYLDGVSLSQILSQVRQELPQRLSLHILTQVLAGLHHFHELTDFDGTWLGAVHRDVSPQNVMVLHDGLVKVLDFGIAKVTASTENATRDGLIKGKIHYMPPEQLLGDPSLDRGADIFAVGVMLWEAIAKRRLWQHKSEGEVVRALATGELPRLRDVAPDVPEDLLQIVDRALAVKRNDRYGTAHDMQIELERLLFNHGESVQPRELSDFMRKHFGDIRQGHELKVKMALRSGGGPDGLIDGIAPARSMAIDESNSHVAQVVSSLPPTRVFIKKKSRLGWGIVLLSVLTVGGAWAIRQHERLPVEAAVQPPLKTVHLEIEALPLGAEIFLDGTRVGQDRYRAKPISSPRNALLEVRAPGYVTERKDITLGADVFLKFALQEEPTPSSPVSTGSSARATPSSGAPVASKPRARPALQAPKLQKSAVSVSSPAAAASDCTPAYTFSADGVKTYKPECF